ncbi:MAG: DUF2953 domain-containing protein [Firmicutes bacterium]|nr:DUF2953 domain-containing protein [Bacillota bacterium]
MLLGLFLFILILVVLLVRFSMDLSFNLEDFSVDYTVRLRLGPYFLAIPAKMTTRMTRMVGNQSLNNFEDVLQNLLRVWSSLDYFFQEIEYLQLDVLIGVGDPFLTALGCGGLWAVVGSFLNGLSSSNRLKNTPEVRIEPNYSGLSLQISFYCIFQFRLGQIIIKELKRLS